MHRALPMIAAAWLAAPAFAYAETEISFEEVPDVVMETALKTAPGVTFYRVSIDIENGENVYEFEAQDYAGKHIEIDVLENGALEEIEMEVEMSEVPVTVVAALERTAPGFEPTYIEMSVRNGGGYFVYEFEGQFDGQEVDIEIDEGGDVLVFAGDTFS